mmetsp:Transcript_40384/g.93686  ORF Transcript_40384/g.93686 Transcript_40384/m.93686 type:complete len:280 (+) Transcript_40384:36-875(+)
MPQEGRLTDRGNDLRARLSARLRVCILGGTAFLNNESEALVKAIASEVHERFNEEGVLFLTCGQQGIQETFAQNCGDGGMIRNLLVAGSCSHFRAGQDIIAGRDAEAVKSFFAEVGDVYLTVEGGPGVAQEARRVLARGATVLPLKRTGGASAGKFDFPEKALSRPAYATEEQWQQLSRNTPPKDAAATVADLLANLLEARGRSSASAATLEIESLASDMISWADTASFAVRSRSCKTIFLFILLALIVILLVGGYFYVTHQTKSKEEEEPQVLFLARF